MKPFADDHSPGCYGRGKDGAPRISALMLERYNLGELSREEKERVDAALAGDPALTERLRGLRASDADIRRRGLAAPAAAPRARRLRPLMWGAAAAALALVIVLPLSRGAPPAGGGSAESAGPSGERFKGNAGMAELRVYLKKEGTQPLPAEGAVFREGDTIQIAYTVRDAGDSPYGVIFSIDGQSALTLHYPYTPDSAARLRTGRQTFLEEAYTLDDAPDYEIFFFVVSDKPLGVKEILKTARQLAGNPETALERGPSVFKNYKLAVLRLRKE